MRSMKYLLIITILMASSKIYSQQISSNMTNQEIVKKFLNGFNNPGYNAPNCATHFAPYSASHFAPNCATFHNE